MIQMLKLNGDAFKEWRYRIKEQGTWAAGTFPESVREAIFTVKPEWKVSPPNPLINPDA